MAGTGGTGPLSEAEGWPNTAMNPTGLWANHIFLLPTFQSHFPIQFLNSAALGKVFNHQGEPKIPRVSQTASLSQAHPSDCAFAKSQT